MDFILPEFEIRAKMRAERMSGDSVSDGNVYRKPTELCAAENFSWDWLSSLEFIYIRERNLFVPLINYSSTIFYFKCMGT